MNLPDYEEIARLRLQLHDVTLQRDAFQVLARKEVAAIIREVLEVNPLIAEYKAHKPTLGMAYDPSPDRLNATTPKPRRRRV